MGVFERMHGLIDRLQSAPGIRQAREAAYRRRFATQRAAHLFYGVYESFDEAQSHAPTTAPVGYDNPASTDLYIGDARPSPHDYPAFFWLSDAFGQGHLRVVDLGGNIGMKFRALLSLTELPTGLDWCVVDVPEVVRRGRLVKEAESTPDPRLRFCDRIGDIDSIDVLFASGVLQYLPNTLGDMLRPMKSLPRRVVVNTTPIHPSRSFFTLNSIGTAYCPYRVTARSAFRDELESLGYRLRAEWINPGKGMHIPFVEGHDVPDYRGMCFDLVA